MKEKYRNLLTKNLPTLVDEIDSDGGLVNFLESKKILTRRQAVTFSRISNPFKRNEAILEALFKRPDEDFVRFCDALRETEQGHVVEQYLTQDSLPSSSSSSSLLSPAFSSSSGELKVLGIELRGKDRVLEVKTIQNNSLTAQELVTNDVSAETQRYNQTSLDGPQLIELDEIEVKKCEHDFYNSNKQHSYQMSRRCRGKCLIISIYHTIGQDPRQGAESDVKILTKLFEELHFQVILHKNLTAENIHSELSKILSDPQLSSDQSFILFMMSHGAIQIHDGVLSEVVFGSDGKPLATCQILQPIAECQALAGKPKLAFFQACRGDHYDQGYTESDSISTKQEEKDITMPDAYPPGTGNLKDFIVGFPTQSGFRSFRNTKNGSWYINAIVRVFTEYSCCLDVTAMLRKVNGMVSQWLPRTTDPRMQQKCQIASISDTLTKPYLYFFPGICDN